MGTPVGDSLPFSIRARRQGTSSFLNEGTQGAWNPQHGGNLQGRSHLLLANSQIPKGPCGGAGAMAMDCTQCLKPRKEQN